MRARAQLQLRASGRNKQVEAGERSARLLNSSAGDEASEVDGRKAEALDQAFHNTLGFLVIPGDEDYTLALALDRPVIEGSHANGIERFNDARPWRAKPATISLAPIPPSRRERASGWSRRRDWWRRRGHGRSTRAGRARPPRHLSTTRRAARSPDWPLPPRSPPKRPCRARSPHRRERRGRSDCSTQSHARGQAPHAQPPTQRHPRRSSRSSLSSPFKAREMHCTTMPADGCTMLWIHCLLLAASPFSSGIEGQLCPTSWP